MGSGSWSAVNHFEAVRASRDAGKDTFDYSASAQRSGNYRAHQSLDPYGMAVRESRDSVEHPDSNAVLISLDVTGSMGSVVRGIHRDLPHLHELLLGHKYIPDPQVLFAAVGDATCDKAPLQVGQFESDNRMDQNLQNMILEGGGGGQDTESYELALYVAARHTAIDCWEKRGRKGYMFIIGDEMAYPMVRRAHVHRLIGIDPQKEIPLSQIIAEVREKYHLYFVIPGGAAHGSNRRILDFWRGHLGEQSILTLHSPDDTSECIAMTIGLNEGVISPGEAQRQLTRRGRIGSTLDRIMQALGGIFSATPTPPASPKVTGTRRL